MTILVRRNALWAIGIAAAGSAVGFAVAAHGVLAALESPATRAAGERLLFLGIVAGSAILALVVIAQLRSISVSRTLEKLTAMSRQTGASPEPGLRRLGELGDRIAQLYSQQLTVGAKKSDKISALSALAEHLLQLEERAVGIADLSGKVLYSSPALHEKLKLSRAEVVGVAADSLIPDLNLTGTFHEFERDRSPIVREIDSGTVTIIPIYSRSGELTYCMCVFGRVQLPNGPHADSTGGAKTKKRRQWRTK